MAMGLLERLGSEKRAGALPVLRPDHVNTVKQIITSHPRITKFALLLRYLIWRPPATAGQVLPLSNAALAEEELGSMKECMI
jgi:hypothetical protein